MKKILIATVPEKGHVNPLIGTAQELVKLGAEVAFFAQRDITPQLNAAKLFCKCYTPGKNTPEFVLPDEFITSGELFAQKVKDKMWLRRWIKTLLIDCAEGQKAGIEAAVKDFEPDIMVCDPLSYAAAIVAEERNLVWAGVSNSLNPVIPDDWDCDLLETLRVYDSDRKRLFAKSKHDIRFKSSDVISPYLNIVFTCEEYAPRNLSGNNFSEYVGAPFNITDFKRGDETDFPFDKLNPDKQKVYMSLGSQLYYNPQLFITAYEALKSMNVQLIFSVNELCTDEFKAIFPADSIIERYTPQLQLLPHIDMMISHGGANSVIEAQTFGVPLALLPICNDQHLQAMFMKNAGAGIVLDPNKPDATEWRKVFETLLDKNSAYCQKARAIKDALSRLGGPQKAAKLIYKL